MEEVIVVSIIVAIALGIQLDLAFMRSGWSLKRYQRTLKKADKALKKKNLKKAQKNYEKIIKNLK
ncbi:MAG TPA: hypothetical protein ENI51_09870 [Candidatus Atribacteria bacterium]|nr:hypothetical protein [Candidatus Atribacteria bacterium]